MEREYFIGRFNEEYGSYITASRYDLEYFYDNYYQDFMGNNSDGFQDEEQLDHLNTVFLDLAKDYILSQGLAEEVIL